MGRRTDGATEFVALGRSNSKRGSTDVAGIGINDVGCGLSSSFMGLQNGTQTAVVTGNGGLGDHRRDDGLRGFTFLANGLRCGLADLHFVSDPTLFAGAPLGAPLGFGLVWVMNRTGDGSRTLDKSPLARDLELILKDSSK